MRCLCDICASSAPGGYIVFHSDGSSEMVCEDQRDRAAAERRDGHDLSIVVQRCGNATAPQPPGPGLEASDQPPSAQRQ